LKEHCLSTVIAFLPLAIASAADAQRLEDLEAGVGRLPRITGVDETEIRRLQTEIDSNAALSEPQRVESRAVLQALLAEAQRQNATLQNRSDIFSYMAKLRALENEIRRIRGSVTFGTAGDTAPTQDQFKA